MTRFVVDCGVVIHLASEGIEVSDEHELLAPTLLRSQTLSALHEAVHRAEIPPDVAFDRRTRIWAMPIRLLGDAVLRRNAWEIAEQLDGPKPTTPSTLRSRGCGGRVRHPGRGTGAPGGRNRPHCDDRGAANGVTSVVPANEVVMRIEF